MALFKPYKITSDKLSELPVREGQIIVTTDTTKLYVDISATERIEVKSDAEVDLTDYVTTNILTAALAEETKEREKQDDLLNDSIAEKLSQGQADDRYALKYNPNLSGNVNILNGNWIAGKITAAHSNGEIEDYYKYVIGFDAIHRPYIAKKEGDNNVSMIYLDTDSIVFNKPLSFTGSSGIESNPEAASQTRQNIGAAAINHTHNVATAGAAGFMSAEDKIKLDGLEQIDTSVFVTKEDADTDYAAINHTHDNRYYTESEVDSKLSGKANTTHTHTVANVTNLQETIDSLEEDIAGKANASHTHDDRYFTETEVTTKLATKADTGHKHAASDVTSGTFALDRIPTITDAKISGLSASKLTGTIPTANLPSYVDDVVEGATTANFPETGEAGKIYVATSTNKTYRWSGSSYVEISASLALGTTSSTAFRGDYGNTAYQHATAKGAAFGSGLYKITTNAQGHVTAATVVTKADITALGIPGQDTNTTYANATTSVDGLMSSEDKTKLDGIAAGANKYTHPASAAGAKSSGLYKITTDVNGHITAATAVTKSDITALGVPAQDTNTNTTYELTKSGSTITLEGSDGSSTSVTDSNTVYTHPTTPGNKHIPAGGSSGQILRWSADGTAAWGADNNTNTTYSLSKSGSTITLTGSDGSKTSVTDANTTYSLSSFGVTATAAELNKLDGVTATAAELNYVDGVTSNIQTQLNGKAASSHSHSNATTSTAGLMSAADKTKLDGIASGANKYTLPAATASALGGVRIGFPESGKNYPVELNDSNQMFVNVPWTDTNTTYTLSSFGITATAAELNKLDGVTATATEINYLDGVTSAIQTQLNGKAASSHTHSYLPLSGGTLTGRLTANGRISAPTSGGSWVSGMTLTNATLGITTKNTNGSYHPVIAAKTYNNHVWNLGTITDTVGFYGFKSGRTENATDWAFTINVANGAVNSTGNITAPTFVGALSGNASTATTATQANYWTTARTLSFTGDVTGSVSVRGDAAMSCALTIGSGKVGTAELATDAVTNAKIATNAVNSDSIASGAVGLSELSSAVGTVAVQSSAPTDSHVKLWIKV